MPGPRTEDELQYSLTFVFPQIFCLIPFLAPDIVSIFCTMATSTFSTPYSINRVHGEVHALKGGTLLDRELLECELDDAFAMTD